MRVPQIDPRRPGPSPGMVLAVASLGGFLVNFLSSAVNVALPLIEAEFHVSAVTLGWISLSYILVAGATLLPAGRVADMYGRMRLYMVGMGLFTVLSLASAFAPSATALLVLRAVHGIALGIGSSTSAALVILAYPPESRGRALGLNVSGVYLGLTLGPVLGGLIVHNLGWRSLFIFVGAFGFADLALAFWKLRGVEWREPRKTRFDFAGSVSYALSLTGVLLGFSLLPSVFGAALIVGGAIGLGVFFWWESRTPDPLLQVRLLRRNRVFAFSNLATLVNYSANAAMIFLMSLYLQYSRGLNAQTAGLVLVTGSLVQAAVSPLAGRLADRMEARHVASTGMLCCVFGLLGLSFLGEATAYWYVIVMLSLLGLGMGLFSTPNMHAITGSVDPHSVGVASAVVATMRRAGQSISMGLATLVLAVEVGRHAIEPSDYPRVLTSVRLSFLLFAILSVLGVAASLVGPRRTKAL